MKPRFAPFVTVLVIAAACAAGGLDAQAPAAAGDRFEPVRQLIRTAMAERGIPSIAIAVARDGEIVWEEGFGWADRERRVRSTAHTPYSVASISKPITATAIMQLVERGELDLDRPANDYLGDGRIRAPVGRRAGEAAQATVRRLLSHTAGLPLHHHFFYDDAGHAPPGMDASIHRYAILVRPPGEMYEYSNIGYGVLDHIIERVGGRSYASFLEEEIFAPLGMSRSTAAVRPGAGLQAAVRYDARQRPIPFYDFDHRGASAVWASAHDLARFGMFHLGEALDGAARILEPEAVLAMQRVETPGDTARGYGIGWLISQEGGMRRVSHTGGMPGVSTALNLYPAERTVIVVLSNSSDRVVQMIARETARLVLDGYDVDAESDASRQARGPGSGGEARPEAEPDRSLAGRWTGALHTYDGVVPLELIVSGEPSVRLGDGRRRSLDPALVLTDRVVGRFGGTIPTEDASRYPHTIVLDLRLRDGRLVGAATAQSRDERIPFALTSYVELEPVP